MKEVCQDMFFSRSRNSPAAQSMLGTASPRPVLENALTGAVAPDDKVNAISELVDMKVDAPTQVDFSDQVCVCFCAASLLLAVLKKKNLPKYSLCEEQNFLFVSEQCCVCRVEWMCHIFVL